MKYPDDVPVQRPSVGAMGWMGSQMPAKITKPYVYQGTGEDQFPETDPDYRPKRKPAPKPKPKREKRRRSEYDRWAQVRYLPLPEPEPEPEPVLAIPVRRTARPALGWRPTTGADLADLLEELEEA